MKNTLKIEVEKPNDSTIYAAMASIKYEGVVSSESNGQFVVFEFENITPLEAFRLGRIYQNLKSIK